MTGLSEIVTKKNLSKINVLYLEDKPSIRTAIRNVLAQEGLTGTRDFTKLASLRATFASHLPDDMPDLVIIDSEMKDDSGDAIQFMGDIRYGKLGKNPYIPIIATLWSADSDLIKRIVDAAADDILLKPFSPNGLMDRIKALIKARKEFIVTSEYIGPDRRKDKSRTSTIPSMPVPNTLASKAEGHEISHLELADAIASVNEQVNEIKMQRNAFQISFVVEMLQPRLLAGEKVKQVEDFIHRLHRAAADTESRLHGTNFEHVSELCKTLKDVSSSLLANLDNPSEKDIQLIKPLSEAILLALNPGSDAESLSGQIAAAVSGFQKRQAERRRLKKQKPQDKQAAAKTG